MNKSQWGIVLIFVLLLAGIGYLANSMYSPPNAPQTENMLAEEEIDNAPAPTPPGNNLRQCPDLKIVNNMPQVISSPGDYVADNSYYIMNGERYELNQFDAVWVEANCNVPIEEVY